jgi:steroid delta-isomerase-like uncharacterized protein
MPSEELKAKREAIVREHVAAENRHAWDETADTFSHPRYEVMPTGEVHEGREPVLSFLAETGVGFPDFRIEDRAMHHADDAVIVEVDFIGTHLGSWRGLPPTGKQVRYSMCNVFVFEEDRLVCERLYFDILTALRQLGIARDPTSLAGRIEVFVNHPITVLGAFLRAARKG